MISKFQEQTKIRISNNNNINNNQTDTTNSNSYSNSDNLKFNEGKIKEKENENNLSDKEIEIKTKNSSKNFFFTRFYKILKILMMYTLRFLKRKKPLVYFLVFLFLFLKKHLIFGFLRRIFFSLIMQKINN